MQAAFADGVIRGSYQKDWLFSQLKMGDSRDMGNDSSVGAIAYVYLKTKDVTFLNMLKEWNTLNRKKHIPF